MKKEGVVFIIDANATMDKPYPKTQNRAKGTPATTRLDCAKQAVVDMISNLMIQSKTNEVIVIVLKTPCTKHHWHDDDDYLEDNDDADTNNCDETRIPFRNITELAGDGSGCITGMSRPVPELLRQIQKIQSAATLQQQEETRTNKNTPTPTPRPTTAAAHNLEGNLCNGIIVGGDALYRRTNKKEYNRRIVLITDAEHELTGIDHKKLLETLDGLREMQCQFQVIGLDFDQSATFSKAGAIKVKQEPKEEEEEENPSDSETDDEDDDDEEEEEDVDPEEHLAIVKKRNEKFLIELTEKTGGFVAAAHEMQQVLAAALGKRISKSVPKKFVFHIAPNLVLTTARYSSLVKKATTPSFKKAIVMVVDKDSTTTSSLSQSQSHLSSSSSSIPQSQLPHQAPSFQARLNALGEEMIEDFKEPTMLYFDPENEDKEITDIGHAFRYGSDFVPMGGYDMQGLMTPSPVCIKILGYMASSKVPLHLCVDTPSVISGADSRRACVAISALARALQRLDQVAIATMVKTKDADPILIGIFPLASSSSPSSSKPDSMTKNTGPETAEAPLHLIFLQLPFQGDVPRLALASFDDVDCSNTENAETAEKMRTCDDLIDALQLPDDVLDYTQIPNPYIRAFHKTVVNRSIDPKCPVVTLRPNVHEEPTHDTYSQIQDPMATPPSIVERARPRIETFRSMFPLVKRKGKDDATSRGKRRNGPISYRDFLDESDVQ
jgi:hypothetical protein